jgi:hypothetical protein
MHCNCNIADEFFIVKRSLLLDQEDRHYLLIPLAHDPPEDRKTEMACFGLFKIVHLIGIPGLVRIARKI